MQEYWLLTDMDGVLVEFNKAASIEDLYSKEYFLKQKPMLNVVKAIRMLQLADNGIRVGSCSKYLEGSNAKKDKNTWLDKYVPEIPIEDRFFCPYSAEKETVIRKDILDTKPALLDDFTPNLKEWNGTAIKLYNGINGTNGTWHGYSVRADMDPIALAASLEALVKANMTQYSLDMGKEQENLQDRFFNGSVMVRVCNAREYEELLQILLKNGIIRDSQSSIYNSHKPFVMVDRQSQKLNLFTVSNAFAKQKRNNLTIMIAPDFFVKVNENIPE